MNIQNWGWIKVEPDVLLQLLQQSIRQLVHGSIEHPASVLDSLARVSLSVIRYMARTD
jgi:hypothetical protein